MCCCFAWEISCSHSYPLSYSTVLKTVVERTSRQSLSSTYASFKGINFAGERLNLSAVFISFLFGLTQGIIVPVSSFREICKLWKSPVWLAKHFNRNGLTDYFWTQNLEAAETISSPNTWNTSTLHARCLPISIGLLCFPLFHPFIISFSSISSTAASSYQNRDIHPLV